MVVHVCVSDVHGVCHCVSTFRMVDTSLQVYLHVYLITQVQQNTHTVLAIVRYVCGVVCINIHAYFCVTCAWCMVLCTCVLVCAIGSAPSEWWMQVYKCTYMYI